MLEQVEFEAGMVAPLKSAHSYISCSLHKAVKIRSGNKCLADLHLQTIPQFFHECCEKYKDLNALAFETPQENSPDGKWTYITYAEYEQNVEQAALLLLHLGVQAHTSVAILAFNCPEWFYVEMAAFRIGAVVTGIYCNNSAEAVQHALETSDAAVCLVDDAQQMSKVRAVKARLNQLLAVVQLNGPFDEYVDNEPGYYRWKDLFAMKFSSALRDELLVRERNVAANECALLIFTSGTVGLPKGVMVSHDGILFCSHIIKNVLAHIQCPTSVTVTYLPLNHIAAQIFDIFMTLRVGGVIHFADRNALKGSLIKTCMKSKANILFGVPRVFEKMLEKFEQIEANSSALKKLVMARARSIMESYHLDKIENKSPSPWKYWLASIIVHRIREAMGLNYLKGCMIGGAPVSVELKKFFLSLDMPLIDAFGMSEASGGTTFNLSTTNLNTVGKPLEGIEIKIDSASENGEGEGEILLRGRCNFMGYLKDEEKTLETFTADGYFRTGDIGHLDDQGNLYISGRAKELIITTGGENIAPAHIEDLIKKELPCVSNVMVVGDGKKYLTVLLTLKSDIDPDTGYPLDTLRPDAVQWLQTLGLLYTHVSALLNISLPENLKNFDPNTVNVNCDAKVSQALEAAIERYNTQAISNCQKIQYFAVLPHDFSIPTNELGPTLKIKRNVVQQKYAEIIEKMYLK